MTVLMLGCVNAAPHAFAQVLIGYSAADGLQPKRPILSQNPSPVLQSPLYGESKSQPVIAANQDQPVDINADTMNYDEAKRTVWAEGNVFLTQGDRIVRADKVTYELDNDIVYGEGNVVLSEPNGDIHYFEKVVLKDKFKDAVAKQMKSVLVDGSRLSSKSGHRVAGDKTIMEGASYTPCEPCKNNPDAAPIWQIKASTVKHNEVDKTISYTNARFETYGIPIAYFPYFSHPDGSVDQKSGLLQPDIGYKSNEGFMLDNRYYIGMSLVRMRPLVCGHLLKNRLCFMVNSGKKVTIHRF